MAAQVEVQSDEVGRSGPDGRLHLSPLTGSNNRNVVEMPSICEPRVVATETNKPTPTPKPRLTPKPFAVEKNPTIKPILAPKPQTKPRPEPTRIAGSKPDLPNSPKPTARLVSTHPNRPAATSFRTPNKLKTGQTTKPVAQPFKPAPPLDPVESSKPSRPVPAGRQKPAASSLFYSKSFKTYLAAEWSGTSSVRCESGEVKEGSITRAKSMDYLAAIGQDEDEKSKAQPEAAVQMRKQPRSPRARPVSTIFPAAPANTETLVPAPRWVARRPLSADLTSKFESIGLSLHHKSPKANTPTGQLDKEEEKTLSGATPESRDVVADSASSDQNGTIAEETAAKYPDEVNPEASVKSRINLFLDSSSPSPGSAADLPSPVPTVPEAESSVGVKQLIKQLTEDTTPTLVPAAKLALKPRPLPLDLTKKFSSEHSPDPFSLTEAADRHEIGKDPQIGVEEPANTPSDHKMFLDLKDSPSEFRKGPTPEGSETGQLWAPSNESAAGAEVHTVRASLFENIVERQSVFMMDQDEPAGTPRDSPSGAFFTKRNNEDDGSLVIATYKEPASPSDTFWVSHAFNTVQGAEEKRAVIESVPAAQWEDKAMTLRSRRSERTRPAMPMTNPAQPAVAAVPDRQPRVLRVGALQKWTTTSFDQSKSPDKGMPQEPEGDGQPALEKDQEEAAAAPKRLKMLQGEEQQKPRATYFALTGQMQEPASPGGGGNVFVGTNLNFDDLSVRSALGGSQGQIYATRRNPSLEEAFGQISPSQEKFDVFTLRNHVPSTEIRAQMNEQTKDDMIGGKMKKEQQKETVEKQAQMDFERMKEWERQREFERQRQKAFETEKRELEERQQRQKLLELEKQNQQESERERQWQLQKEKRESERQKELERQREKEKQKEALAQESVELERQRLREKAEMEAKKSRQMALEQEMLKMKELEKKTKQRERELEKQRQREMEKERRQQEAERQQLEKERREQENERKRIEELERLKELERQQLAELEKQRSRERAEKEAERLRQMALEQEMLRIRELEKERERQKELEMERKLEIKMEKERELEKQRQRQLDMEREQLESERLRREQERKRKEELERTKEMERQRAREREEKEAEKLRQMALEQEMLKIKELEKERAKQRELEREIDMREREKQNQREMEKEKQKKLDLEKQQFEKERLRREQEKQKQKQRREMESEIERAREKMEKAEAENMRLIAKQQETERQRLREKQKKEEQERIRLEASALRPKVLDLDTLFKSDLMSPSSPQHSDPSPRWREPYKPAILDIDSFTSHSQGSQDLLPGLNDDFGLRLHPTPDREANWKAAPQTSGGFSSPVWTTSPQDPWELWPVEMSVDKPVTEPKKAADKLSPEQLLLKQEEQHPSPQRHRAALLDEPPFLSLPHARISPHEVSPSSLGDQVWVPREPQPPKERKGDARSHRRSQGSQELNPKRSRSMSRRPAPLDSAVEGSLFRMRSRSAHREQDPHSPVQQKQSDKADSGTPVRDADSQYGTWETGLHTDESLTPATPSSESNLSPSLKKPTPLPSPGDRASATDGNTPSSSSESQPLSFPDAPTTLLDTSAMRSRPRVGNKRAPRTRPSKAPQLSAASPQGDGENTPDYLYRDSTEAKAESKHNDSEPEDPAKGADAGPAVHSQPQRVALFPGVDPSALKAHLKKRGDSDNQTDGAAPAPSHMSRSPKSPFLPRAARVLPPSGVKENGQENSPQWLKELKSKKRLSHYENES